MKNYSMEKNGKPDLGYLISTCYKNKKIVLIWIEWDRLFVGLRFLPFHFHR
jgi:hypothetical protein